jgi:hypothetical protein
LKLDPAATLEFVRSIWSSFEPASNSTFEMLDSQILRVALETRFRGQFGDRRTNAGRFNEWINEIVGYQNFPDAIVAQWQSFLKREISPSDAPILSLSSHSPASPDRHFGIISRAALLLRICIGSIRKLLSDAGLSGSAISFWSRDFGKSRGIWSGEDEDALLNLWADVEPLLEEIESFQSKYTAAEQTFLRAGVELGSALIGLSAFERVALWGVMDTNSR